MPPSPRARNPVAARRGNPLGVAGWAAVTDALEGITGLKSLNGCGQYAAIRAGGLQEMALSPEWELGVWAVQFLERHSSTLTTLDVRCRALAWWAQRAEAVGGRAWEEGRDAARARERPGLAQVVVQCRG